MNLIDYIIIGLLALALIRGYTRGAIVLILDILSFFFSIVGAFYLTSPLAPIIDRLVNVPDQLVRTVAFGVAFGIVQVILSIFNWLILRLTVKIEHSLINRILGLIISLFYALVLIGVILITLESVPINKKYRAALEESRLSALIGQVVAPLRLPVDRALQTAIQEVSKVITVNPDPSSAERRLLHINPKRLEINQSAEQQLLAMVNQERQKQGANTLAIDQSLTEVARDHARDMWQRQYFSHVNPDGQDPFDRLKVANVQFITAGENLALAPTVGLAHEGLMNSAGHRANILEGAFGRVGLGVIDGAPFGEMVVQVFAD